MDSLFGEILMSVVGRISLWIRYRKKQKIEEIIANEYSGSYALAGSDYFFRAFAGLLVILLLVFLIVVIIRIFVS